MGLGLLAAGEGGDHLVHEARNVADRHARDSILAADHAHAEGLHGLDQAFAHEAARRAEGPCLQVCIRAHTIKFSHTLACALLVLQGLLDMPQVEFALGPAVMTMDVLNMHKAWAYVANIVKLL